MALFDLPLEELRHYTPDVPEPDDFDARWSETLTRARQQGGATRSEPVATGLQLFRTWDVTFTGWGGHPVRAWWTVPAGATGELSTVVEFLGYGRGRGLPHERLVWPAAGYAHLLMDSRGQGGQYGNGGATEDPVGSCPSAPGFLTRGIADTETHYYRRLITDAVRAVDVVAELPGADSSRVAVAGASQGGALALAVAGLRDDLAAVLASVPFLCHAQRAIDLTDADPWAEVVRYLATHRDQEAQVLTTLAHVDGVNFARRATAPALFAVGLRDTVCPPSTVFAAYNHYGSRGPDAAPGRTGPDRQIEVYPYNHHEGGDAVHVRRSLDWLASRSARSAAA